MRRIAARPLQGHLAQRGQVLLILLAILGIGFGGAFYAFVSPGSSTIERDKITAAALAQAKDALIGYAAGQNTAGSYRPGELPCPDTNNDGGEESSCDTPASRIGRLPWKKLGLPDLRDSAGERLWYAVSNTFKNSPQTTCPSPTDPGCLNSDAIGDYTITGNTPASNVIAIVFAPGAALGTQVRDTANANNFVNYLEGENANGDLKFTTAPASGTFNDKLLLITPDNFFPAVETRVAREARSVLLAFYGANDFFPYANTYSDSSYQCTNNQYTGRIPRYFIVQCKKNPADGDWKDAAWPGWFFSNNWHQILFYAVSSKCTKPSSPNCGDSGALLTVNGMPAPNNNIQVLIMTPGRAFAGQTRPCAADADCLDAPNVGAYPVFTKPVMSSSVNDRLIVVSP